MFTFAAKEAMSEEIGFFPEEYVGSRIYVIRDGKTVFYVGQSTDPCRRIQQHLGYELGPVSKLGNLILANQPQSEEWEIDCYRLSDCRSIFEQSIEFPDEKLRESLVNFACFDVNTAERYMINALRPCLNGTHNAHPSSLPEKYRRRPDASSALKLG